MGFYEDLGDVVDGVREALERAPGLLDQGQVVLDKGADLMRDGASLMKRGSRLMDRTTETLERVDGLIAATATLVDRRSENELLERQRLELEIARLRGERSP